MSKIIHVLAFPNVQVLDVTGPLQVFASANDLARQRGLSAPYCVSVIASQSSPIMTSAGLALVGEPLPAIESPCDTLIIAGGWGVYGAAEDHELVDWVRQKAFLSRRVTSVCTGAFLLAATGLLDGRRVATHWTRCEELAFKYPKLKVEANPISVLFSRGMSGHRRGSLPGLTCALRWSKRILGKPAHWKLRATLWCFSSAPAGNHNSA